MGIRTFREAILVLAGFGALSGPLFAQSGAAKSVPAEQSATNSWKFAVSGDSRNCGDVVMPAIAAGVKKSGAQFYWHLGDLRAIYDFDEDIVHELEHLSKPLPISDYEALAWNDFIKHQIEPFGGTPFFLGIGNHETISPKTREQFIIQFTDWLDSSVLQAQRLADDPNDRRLRTYYHWIVPPVDFVYLDNATPDQFDDDQIKWFEKVLSAAKTNPQIRTVVVGMHEALPESISADHSMNQSAAGIESGRRVYTDLLRLQNENQKRVYILSSHSHYFMEGIFNTDYWRVYGGILPGWIVGTAGAQRYKLPEARAEARVAKNNIYGFLVGAVKPDGEIEFNFHEVSVSDVSKETAAQFGRKPGETEDFVPWCFDHNTQDPKKD